MKTETKREPVYTIGVLCENNTIAVHARSYGAQYCVAYAHDGVRSVRERHIIEQLRERGLSRYIPQVLELCA